jgi:hypothetical protein
MAELDAVRGSFPDSLCLGCLTSHPSEVLSCGHVLCQACISEEVCPVSLPLLCVNSADKPTIKDEIWTGSQKILSYCPICGRQVDFSPTRSILPPTAGYRALSLDGGGIRGIVQITILQAIERELHSIQAASRLLRQATFHLFKRTAEVST